MSEPLASSLVNTTDDVVVVERADDVIPQVVKPIKEERSGKKKRFPIPRKRPVCGSEVVISEDQKGRIAPTPPDPPRCGST